MRRIAAGSFGKIPTTFERRSTSLFNRTSGLNDCDLAPVGCREHRDREGFGPGCSHRLSGLREPTPEGVGHFVSTGLDLFLVPLLTGHVGYAAWV